MISVAFVFAVVLPSSLGASVESAVADRQAFLVGELMRNNNDAAARQDGGLLSGLAASLGAGLGGGGSNYLSTVQTAIDSALADSKKPSGAAPAAPVGDKGFHDDDKDVYAPPAQAYGAPAAPAPVYGAPAPAYGAPAPPAPVYGAPAPVYGAPTAPAPVYGVPAVTYSPPVTPSYNAAPNKYHGVPKKPKKPQEVPKKPSSYGKKCGQSSYDSKCKRPKRPQPAKVVIRPVLVPIFINKPVTTPAPTYGPTTTPAPTYGTTTTPAPVYGGGPQQSFAPTGLVGSGNPVVINPTVLPSPGQVVSAGALAPLAGLGFKVR